MSRASLVAAAVATGILAVSAAGTAALTTPPPRSLAVFERPPTATERERAEQFATGSVFYLQERPDVRLLLTTEEGERSQDVWALRLDAGDGAPDSEICLLTTRRGSEQEFFAGCMRTLDVARRGFLPLDEPPPIVTVDGEQQIVRWGPTGDARLEPRRTAEPAG
ncbi:hypothetical protein [Yonghaparkia sp. Root332]|uniref:hypothetical protein n=1 Tax=Yonghaparkia sp. Root332 TaxID=1736516 RepID=UPI0006F6753C|nr:hypothetical protein [Yonghaparkia sp. Root332]KQV25239.1 hypothetical protein ASC54_12440 [Yonghaparkia sp. Root332]